VSYYRHSSAVFPWEIANEARCPMAGCEASVFVEWGTKTSAFIKRFDPTHLITTEEEGFTDGGDGGSYVYTLGEGIDFEANLKIPVCDGA